MSDTAPSSNRRLDLLLVVGVMTVVLVGYVGFRTTQNGKQIAHDYEKIEALEQVVQEDDQTFAAMGERLRLLELAVNGAVGDDAVGTDETLVLVRRDLTEANRRLNTLAGDMQELRDALNKCILAVDTLQGEVRRLERRSVGTAPPAGTGEGQAKPGQVTPGEDLRDDK